MQTDIRADVAAFHNKFGHAAPSTPTPIDPDTLEFRKKLIREEAGELCEALDTGNKVKICREAVDLIYVAVGALVNAGLPFEEVWEAVQDANMEKVSPPAGSPRGTKPTKPPGWVSPDARIENILEGLFGGQAVS